MKNLILLFVFILLFFSCKNENNKTNTSKSNVNTVLPLSFKKNSLSLQSDLCNNENEMECATVKMDYYLAAGGKKEIREKINTSLEEILANNFIMGEKEDVKNQDLEKIAKSFITDYEHYLSDEKNRGFITPFANETETKILYESPEVICFSFSNYSNTGGAHPNYFTLLANFNKVTGEQIKGDQILKDRSELAPILEVLAKEKYKISEDQNLKDIGLYYEGDAFPVNDNIGILKDSIILEYNPYEVGPYVLGGITFKIAKSDIQDLLK